jgi:hypothetical protein
MFSSSSTAPDLVFKLILIKDIRQPLDSVVVHVMILGQLEHKAKYGSIWVLKLHYNGLLVDKQNP